MSANNAAGGSSVGPRLVERSADGCQTLRLELHALDLSTEMSIGRLQPWLNRGPARL
jgi:hypothetical protein